MLRLSFRRIKLFHDEFPLEKQLNLTKRCLSDHVREYYIETKFSGDKNNIPKNYVTGRGIEVQAETYITYITESTLKSVLKVSECDGLTILYVS